jgi:hypothetical protein
VTLVRRAVDRCPHRTDDAREATMPEHLFELTISGALDDDRSDALVDAGCDDATFSTKGDMTFADFTRAAPKGQRGPGGFPAPASHATGNPLWRQLDTERSLVLGAINGALQARGAHGGGRSRWIMASASQAS